MQIIHAADIHLGSKLDSKFTKEITEQRKVEVRGTFNRMVEYARNQNIKIILLSGDVFDSDKPYKKDKDFFYSVVKNNPEIDFVYLRGNHDISAPSVEETPENLKMFSSEWQTYTYDDVVIWGLEISAENALSMYSSLAPSAKKVNIVMIHGTLDDSIGKDKICLKKLKNKNIDYLALGHIHKPESGKLDEHGIYVYPGCLEGRGFDEAGEHGFELLDISDGKISHKFVPFAERTIEEHNVDISETSDCYEVYRLIRQKISFNPKNIYRIKLVGEIDFDTETIESELQHYLAGGCYFVNIKNGTKHKINIESFEKDLSLRGEFVRTVNAKTDLTEDEKFRIITYGLKALRGEKQ